MIAEILQYVYLISVIGGIITEAYLLLEGYRDWWAVTATGRNGARRVVAETGRDVVILRLVAQLALLGTAIISLSIPSPLPTMWLVRRGLLTVTSIAITCAALRGAWGRWQLRRMLK